MNCEIAGTKGVSVPTNGGGDWCVLRMAAPRTVTVVQSLVRVGIEVWTPTDWVPCRPTKTRSRRKRPVPLLSTFAFARAEWLPELIAIMASPTSKHPDFSILRHGDGFALVEDPGLQGLRDHEVSCRRATDRSQPAPVFKIGDPVKLPKRDAFASMNGVVEKVEGKFYVIGFPGWSLPIKAEPWEMAKS